MMKKIFYIITSLIFVLCYNGNISANNLDGYYFTPFFDTDTVIIHSTGDTVIKLTSDRTSENYDWTALNPEDIANMSADNTKSINVVSHPLDTAVYIVTTFTDSDDNMIPNGDFEQGNTGFTSGYTYTSVKGSRALWDQGKYTVGDDVSDYHERWASCSNGTKMFIANGGADYNSIVYSTDLNVEQNTDYIVSFEACNIASSTADSKLSKFQFSINDIQLGEIHQVQPIKCTWSMFYQIWNSADNIQAKIKILNKNTENDGNDFALDNMNFRKIIVTHDTFVVINTFDFDTLDITICQGGHYDFAGQSFYTDTVCNDTSYQNHVITTLNLKVNPAFDTVLYDTVCDGQYYTLNGFNENKAGTYTLTLKTEEDCDSIITLHLEVYDVYNDTIFALSCGEGYSDNGFNEEESGFYTLYLTTKDGCDSIVNLDFTRIEPFSDTIDAEIYLGDTFTLYGFAESESGQYTMEYQDTNGCDSTYLLNLKVITLKFPNAVTPNGDGINDIFEVQDLLEQTMFEETTLKIYNRYGRTIFKTVNPKTKDDLWNPDNTNTPTGTYFYRFTAKSKKKNLDFVGTIEVLR